MSGRPAPRSARAGRHQQGRVGRRHRGAADPAARRQARSLARHRAAQQRRGADRRRARARLAPGRRPAGAGHRRRQGAPRPGKARRHPKWRGDMSDVLARICADKRRAVEAAKAARPLAVLEREAAAATPPRGFIAALDEVVSASGYGLIAEIKRASPSRGLIRADFAPAALALAYERGGAACLSVLTDAPYFEGEPAHLVAARAAVTLPVLRKDFILDPYQVVEARAMGADCILLIMAALSDDEARALEAPAERWTMDLLVALHAPPTP